jgi:hypothetical protein
MGTMIVSEAFLIFPVQSAVKKMKNDKAARPDGIPAEALKTDVKTTSDMLLMPFEKILDEEIPTD